MTDTVARAMDLKPRILTDVGKYFGFTDLNQAQLGVVQIRRVVFQAV